MFPRALPWAGLLTGLWPWPVMLVIGTFFEEDEPAVGKDKVEFADVRWMEISSVLRRESANRTN